MRKQLPTRLQLGYHSKPRQVTSDDLTVMELPARFWNVTPDYFSPMSRVREVIDAFGANASRIIADGDPSLILLHGEHDTAKTSAAAMLAIMARSYRFSVFFLDAGDILRTFPTDRITEDGEQTYRERAYSADVLVLDDLGGGYASNEFVATETIGLVKHRQDNLLLTIITTSAVEHLPEQFGKGIIPLVRRSSTIVKCVDKVQSIAGGDL